ncbi:MAG: hypothetical protein CG437_1349 [Methanosaeta sp. NSP1]|nr:MAG: hypothetical protein CG437_1349 [Methanosaeta sp. NSP1]
MCPAYLNTSFSALWGQPTTQAPHWMHFPESATTRQSSKRKVFVGQMETQAPQCTHSFSSRTTGISRGTTLTPRLSKASITSWYFSAGASRTISPLTASMLALSILTSAPVSRMTEATTG